MKTVKFRQMKDGDREDYRFLDIHERAYAAGTADRLLAAMAELDESKKHFDRALEINGGKFLAAKLNYATRYYCFKSDKANYNKLLNEVLAAGDELPDARLPNVIAKRRARRYLGNKIWQENCGF